MKATKAALAVAEREGLEQGILRELLGFHVRRLSREIGRAYGEQIGDQKARPGGFTALALIAANPGLSQTALAREMGFDKATIVALLDTLEAQGWAVRTRASADRRRHSLAITRAGETALRRLHEAAEATESPMRGVLSAAELRRLIDLLDRAHAGLTAREG